MDATYMLQEVALLVETHFAFVHRADEGLLIGVDPQMRVELTQACEYLEAQVALILEELYRYILKFATLDHGARRFEDIHCTADLRILGLGR